MSVKKLIVLTAAGVASVGLTSAFAGGPDMYAPPAMSDTGVYLEANGGYAIRNWNNLRSNDVFHDNQANSLSNVQGGFTGIGDLGYQFNSFWAVEAGYIYLPKVKGTDIATSNVVSDTSYGLYAGFKLSVPVYSDTYLYGKLAAAYQHNKLDNAVATAGGINPTPSGNGSLTQNYWDPMFAAGIQYYFTPRHDWSINGQYTYLMGYDGSSSTGFGVPDSNLFTVGVGYKFAV